MWTKSYDVTIQMKAPEQYLPVVLFIMLYKAVQTFESVSEILKCDHSNESYWAVLSCGTVYYAVQGGSNLSYDVTIHMKALFLYFHIKFHKMKFGRHLLLAKFGIDRD